ARSTTRISASRCITAGRAKKGRQKQQKAEKGREKQIRTDKGRQKQQKAEEGREGRQKKTGAEKQTKTEKTVKMQREHWLFFTALFCSLLLFRFFVACASGPTSSY
ncbi:MAG: hypothetical protein LC121_03475, partial [Anaerolineae bacterium]|nr:hypothetical protein [Anaerolineae bacterium]